MLQRSTFSELREMEDRDVVLEAELGEGSCPSARLRSDNGRIHSHSSSCFAVMPSDTRSPRRSLCTHSSQRGSSMQGIDKRSESKDRGDSRLHSAVTMLVWSSDRRGRHGSVLGTYHWSVDTASPLGGVSIFTLVSCGQNSKELLVLCESKGPWMVESR